MCLSDDSLNQRDICITCYRSKSACFCDFVKPFDTRTRFLILMHPKEYKRQRTGTGRLTHRALRNSEIIVGVNLDDNRRLISLLNDSRYSPMVLFPGPKSYNLSIDKNINVPEEKGLLLIILDGTWTLAKKIYTCTRLLHSVPQICFTPPSISQFTIKRQPADYCVSTIEATYYLLDILEQCGRENLDGAHCTLIDGLASLVKFQKSFY